MAKFKCFYLLVLWLAAANLCLLYEHHLGIRLGQGKHWRGGLERNYEILIMQNNLPRENDPSAGRRILALDLGIGSYGIALQERSGEGDNRQFSFPIVRSCTLPGDWAELKEERTRRRMWRTRLAHIEREGWLRQVFERCGLQEAVLWGPGRRGATAWCRAP